MALRNYDYYIDKFNLRKSEIDFIFTDDIYSFNIYINNVKHNVNEEIPDTFGNIKIEIVNGNNEKIEIFFFPDNLYSYTSTIKYFNKLVKLKHKITAYDQMNRKQNYFIIKINKKMQFDYFPNLVIPFSSSLGRYLKRTYFTYDEKEYNLGIFLCNEYSDIETPISKYNRSRNELNTSMLHGIINNKDAIHSKVNSYDEIMRKMPKFN